MDHEAYMKIALEEARKAYEIGEVPIGAIVVKDNQIIGRGHNLRETGKDPTLHAEIIALRQAAKTLGGWRLTDAYLYVTIEPCVMCAGAIYQGRIRQLIYGAKDPKAGGVDSLYSILTDERLNHQTQVISGCMEQEASQLMKDFFKALRK